MASKEEELQILKRLVAENLEKSRKRAFRSSLALVAMILISAASMTYAYIQQVRTDQFRHTTISCMEMAQEQRILADLNAKKVSDMRGEVQLVAEALKKCEESKEKK